MATRRTVFSVLVLSLLVVPQAAGAKAPVKGDFNGDGTADLAISSPRYPSGLDVFGPGSVNILYAAAHGHPLLGGSLWSQSTPGIKGAADPVGRFGYTLATGDFNGDGKADLAIGAPYHSLKEADGSMAIEAGSVNVLYGSKSGIKVTGNQLWTVASPGVPRPQSDLYAYFGAGLAVGDFDGDGRDDLAVSALGYGPLAHPSGGVLVFRGTKSGLTATGIRKWTLGSPHILGDPHHAEIGVGITAGDFDHDGADDLAVYDTQDGPPIAAGRVNVLYGVKGHGLSWHRNQLWSQGSPGVKGVPEVLDRFGQTLVTGDFDGDHFADLGIAVPDEDLGPGSGGDQGAVEVLYGSRKGLTATGNQLWTLDSPGIPGHSELTAEFGAELAAGDFNGDGRDELVIDSGRATVDGHPDAGEVLVIPGSKHGLTANGSRLWTVDTPGVPGTVLTDRVFGDGLATGDFDADGRDDLALGISGATVHGKEDAGAVDVLFGTNNGLSTSRLQRLTRATSGVDGPVQANGDFGATIR
jgi:FG-GAP repeat